MTTLTQTANGIKASKPRKHPERHARISHAVNGCYAMLLPVGKDSCGYERA
jgi:hypothetical protein